MVVCVYSHFFFLFLHIVLLCGFTLRLEVRFHLLDSLFCCHSHVKVGSGIILYLEGLCTFLDFFLRFFIVAIFVIHNLSMFDKWSSTTTVVWTFDCSRCFDMCPCYAIDDVIMTCQHLYDRVLLDKSCAWSCRAFLFNHFAIPDHYTFILWCWCE